MQALSIVSRAGYSQTLIEYEFQIAS